MAGGASCHRTFDWMIGHTQQRGGAFARRQQMLFRHSNATAPRRVRGTADLIIEFQRAVAIARRKNAPSGNAPLPAVQCAVPLPERHTPAPAAPKPWRPPWLPGQYPSVPSRRRRVSTSLPSVAAIIRTSSHPCRCRSRSRPPSCDGNTVRGTIRHTARGTAVVRSFCSARSSNAPVAASGSHPAAPHIPQRRPAVDGQGLWPEHYRRSRMPSYTFRATTASFIAYRCTPSGPALDQVAELAHRILDSCVIQGRRIVLPAGDHTGKVGRQGWAEESATVRSIWLRLTNGHDPRRKPAA